MKKMGITGVVLALGLFALGNSPALGQAADSTAVEVDNLKINGEVDGEKAGFVITGDFKPSKPDEEKVKLIFSARTENIITHRRGQTEQIISGTVKTLQGAMKELRFAVNGKGTLVTAKSDQAIEWGLRNDKSGQRYFVLWFDPEKPARGEVKFTAHFRNTHAQAKAALGAISLSPQGEAVLNAGLITVTTAAGYDLAITAANGVTRVTKGLGQAPPKLPRSYSFQFRDTTPEVAFSATESDPDANRIFFDGFDLKGSLADGVAAFTLNGMVEVRHARGGKLPVVFGGAALASIPATKDYKVSFSGETYTLEFAKGGTYPVALEFHARILEKDGWNNIDFGVVPAALRPVKLSGWPKAISFDAKSASKPAIKNGNYDLFLTPQDRLSVRWKETKPVVIPKLFYSAEATVNIAVGAGLARQINHFDYRVMQGRMSTLELDLIGEGEVVSVNGQNILNWSVKKQEEGRQLVVKLNSQQTANYNLVVHSQTPLGAFPVRFHPLRLVPVNPVRYGGHLRLVNKGAVQLEPVSVDGLSQLSANRFPAASSIAALPNNPKLKPLVYRYSGGDYELEVLADNILPELTVSQLLVYALGFNEITLDAEVELTIRDAPLREFTIRIPNGYTVAQLSAAALADYFLGPAENGKRPLRLVFSQPLEGRHLIQLRLEQNQALEGDEWSIPRLDYEQVKSVRGFVGVSASPGLRLDPAAVKDVNEIAVVFFPKKIPGLQAAYRIKETGWEASLGVVREELALQVDALHLYSIGQGIVYGSSVLNYLIGGKPVSELKVLVPADYANVEFVGRDVRNWKLDDAADNSLTKSYTVYFQSTVFGDYTLLVTFERQFNPEGETLAFNGVRPVDVQQEVGYSILISKERFEQSQPEATGKPIALEPSEIPEEYRLLFDAPILEAYQYSSGGFTLNKHLKPLNRQDSLEQVADRAAFTTQVSNDGQAVTTATYYLKNRGRAHFEVTPEAGIKLWETKVTGKRVLPIMRGDTILVPLPKGQNLNAPIEVLLKFAHELSNDGDVRVALPEVDSPLLLSNWKVNPDPEYRLDFVAGNASPTNPRPDSSGFAWLKRGGWGLPFLFAALAALAAFAAFAGGLIVRWGTRSGRYRWDWQNTVGQVFGWLLLLAALGLLASVAALGVFVDKQFLLVEPGLVFTSSALKANEALSITVNNLEADAALYSGFIFLPALVGLVIWVLRFRSDDAVVRKGGLLVGWLFIAWTSLMVPNGLHCFAGLAILFVLVHVAWPSVTAQSKLPPKPPKPPAPSKPTEGSAPAAAAAIAILLGLFLSAGTALGQAAKPDGGRLLSVVQSGQVASNRVTLTGTLKWEAKAGSRIQFLSSPAVLKSIDLKDGKLKLAQFTVGKSTSQQLIANEAGVYDVGFEYETRMKHSNGMWGFTVPTQPAMVNLLSLEMRGQELEVTSTDAVSLEHTFTKDRINTIDLVLPPKPNVRVNWKPKARDESIEKPVFYAEFQQLFIPTAGIVAGVHDLKVRLAQGQLSELTIAVPDGITVTDATSKLVNSWRFDPEVGTLQIQFSAPQKATFDLRVRSQQTAGAFPYEKTLGLLGVNGAAGELGLAGLGTSSEVQLDSASVDGLAPINLEDFPEAMAQSVQGEFAGLTVRRAYRYSGRATGLTLTASAVQPDIRITSSQRLSLGEDRSVLLVNLATRITRAGVFKLSFVLPEGLEVESITGNTLSHWTDIKNGDDTVVTLHLKGKTEGNAQFQINLAGAGLEKTESWQVPRVVIREATKENGQLFIIPEQGIRVYMKDREGVSQLDPKQAGIRDRGVLAFRLLQGDWMLSFDVERVDPWIQAVFLQDASIRQGMVKYRGVVEYQIENTSVKTLRVSLPDAANGVGFSGDQVTAFDKGDTVEDGRAVWDVKLDRRMIGKYQLTLSYQVQVSEDAAGSKVEVQSLQAVDVNLQRGFISVRTEGRILLKAEPAPDGLYSVEWSQVPRSLKGALNLEETQLVFRSVKAATLSVTAQIQEIASVADAQVIDGEIHTELSGSGNAVTHVRLRLRQGDERELRVTLPKDSRFWSAFIDGKGVLPWEDNGEVVIPLEKNSGEDSVSVVEFYYQSSVGKGEDMTLGGPDIDLPMENLKWTIHAPAGLEIEVDEVASTVTYHEAKPVLPQGGISVSSRGGAQAPQSDSKVYLDKEYKIQQRQTQKAEQMLEIGNQKIAEGDQREARRALESAYKLSQNDAAFNEDARVQLQKLKTQQAMMGINIRRNNFLISNGVVSQQIEQQQAVIPLQQGKGVKYTQAQVKQVMDLNTIEDKTAFRQLAERIVRQQEAIEAETGAIQATLPNVGQVLNFSQSVQGKGSRELRVVLSAKAGGEGFPTEKLGLLLALFIAFGLIHLAAPNRAAPKPE